MSPSFWKRMSLIQAVCILVLILGAIWWNQRTKSRTRIETLRSLYEFLKPAPSDDSIYTPFVVDLTTEHGELRRHVNGQKMDAESLSRFASLDAKSSPLAPIIVRPANGLPIEQVVETMRLMAEHGSKIFILPFEKETLALTDRNITAEGRIPDLSLELPSAPK
jgi:hypothetical protein